MGANRRKVSAAFWMRTCTVLALVGMMLSVPFSAWAQTLRGNEYTTSIGDHTVTWTDDWTASVEGDDDFSTMVMLEGQIMIYAVMFVHDTSVALSPRTVYSTLSDVLISSFDTEPFFSRDWQGEDGAYRGLHVMNLSGIDFVIYMRVDPAVGDAGPIMQFGAAPLQAFPSSLAAMQEQLTVDGLQVFDGEDADAVVDIIDDAAAATPSASAAEDAERAPAPASENATSIGLPGSSAISPRIAAASSSGGSYVSDDTGYTVTYGDTWADMAATNSTIGEFSLVSTTNPTAVVSFTGRATTESNREAYFDDIVARESRHEGYRDSVITDDRLLIVSWTSETELSVLEYVFVNDETVVTVMVTITGSKPELAIPSVRGIELDGNGILRDWDLLEID